MIRFDADGWVGVISHDFTFQSLTMVVQALASYLVEMNFEDIRNHRGVIIGYDTRFLSDEYALWAAQVLAGNGILTYLSDKPIITPVLSCAVEDLHALAGLMITASHKSYKYNGIKIQGSSTDPEAKHLICCIEDYIGCDVRSSESNNELIIQMNLDQLYLQKIKELVDVRLIKDSGLRVIIDVMYGAGKGYFKDILSGEKTHIIEIRNTVNPSFGGIDPEPIGDNLRSAMNLLPGFNADLALALDGDGDQLGVIDNRGQYVDSRHITSLLVNYMGDSDALRRSRLLEVALTARDGVLSGLKLLELLASAKTPLSELLSRSELYSGNVR